MLLVAGSEDEWATLSPGDVPPVASAIARWEAAHRRTGSIVAAHELAPTRAATTLRRDGDRVEVCDGPIARADASLGGCYVIDVPDLDAAISLARTSPFLDIAEIEIRPVVSER